MYVNHQLLTTGAQTGFYAGMSSDTAMSQLQAIHGPYTQQELFGFG
jgi:hypothetical protein